MKLLFKQGQIIDWQRRELVQRDVCIEGGGVVAIGPNLPEAGCQVIGVDGHLISAGLIDVHVHLRQPGFEEKETIATGTKAAARGGFTTVACMPNTNPITDSPQVVQTILGLAEKEGSARVLPIGAITIGGQGEEMTDMAALKKAGIVAVSDDGVGVQSSQMMKEAMQEAARLRLPVVAHCEDDTLAADGCVHEGQFAARYGLEGIPSEAEAVHVGRDILLAEATGAHYHVCHISAESSVRLVREAKARGVQVTAEVTPHHLLLCEEDIPGPDPRFKMNPPLRSRRDQAALLKGILDGTIDMIATDHAPHTEEEKAEDMDRAPFGVVGLETAFPLLYTHLVLTGKLNLLELIEKMTRRPAALFSLTTGELQVGGVADLTVIDLQAERTIDPATFYSKGRNTPFAGWKAKGWPVLTMVEGKVVWAEDRFWFKKEEG